jgi:hypothetical protein
MGDNISQQTKTIKFTVGGKTYEVTRSLIDGYPETMLARLISDTWQSDDRDTPIFIESDGEQFRYILQYMRHKKIHLPNTISKAAVLQDLDYFGFEVKPGEICDGRGQTEAARQMAKCETQYQEELKACDADIGRMERKKKYLKVAHACFLRYSKTGKIHNYHLNRLFDSLSLAAEISTSFGTSFDKEAFEH